MKKSMLSLIVSATLFAIGPKPAFADYTALAGQFNANVVSHGVAATEFTTKGETKMVTLLTPFQAGHYKGDYILGQDDGIINNNVNDGRIAVTFGIHAHVISFIRNLMADSTLLDGLEATPRVSYDSDVHASVYGFMLGFEKNFGGTTPAQ